MTRAAWLFAGVLVAVVVAGCGGTKQTETTPVSGTTIVVRVYLVRGGKVQPVERAVPTSRTDVAAGWQELGAGPKPEEAKLGLSSSVVVDRGWKLKTESDGAVSLTTVEQPRVALAQIVYTLTQFAPTQPVIVNGRRYTRADFEAETPAILVESPLPDQTVANPLRMTGTANTFEATFLYELVDSAGKVVAKHFATATSGSGTRGTFDVTIPYPTGHGGPGKLVVYESSAKDGSRIHTVEIPLRLTG